MIANSEKMKIKKSHLILVSPSNFLKQFLPLPNFLETLYSPLKKGVGEDGKLMFFHLKIYVILFNSFCVFLLEHTDVFWMFLLLPAIKNKTIIQNKQKINNPSHPPVEQDYTTNQWKLFKRNKPTRQLSFWEFKILSTLQQKDHLLFISLIFSLQGCLPSWSLYSYSDWFRKFFPRYCFTIIALMYTSVKPSC